MKMIPQVLLSILFIGGYFVVLYSLIAGDLKIDNTLKDAILLLIGIITREVPTIMQFWFGSSHGSKNKDKSKEVM